MTLTQYRETNTLALAGQAMQLFDFGAMLVKSGMLPSSVRTPEAAVTIMVKGMELGLPPMAALNGITVIQGKPTVSPQLMLSLIDRSGLCEDRVVDTGPQGATVTMKRRGRSPFTAKFGPAEAQAMGLNTKDNYKKQAPVMYQWRAVAACARVVFPDVIDGLYTPEEMGADVQVDEDGAMTVTAVQEAKPAPTQAERRQTDVTREVQQAAGLPERTTQADPQEQEKLNRWRDRARKLNTALAQKYPDLSTFDLTHEKYPDWDTDWQQARRLSVELEELGKQMAAKAPAPQQPAQDVRAVAIARKLGQQPYGFKGDERAERLAFLSWLVAAGQPLTSTKDLTPAQLELALNRMNSEDGSELLERWNVSRQEAVPAQAASPVVTTNVIPAPKNHVSQQPVIDAQFTELPGVDDDDLPF